MLRSVLRTGQLTLTPTISSSHWTYRTLSCVARVCRSSTGWLSKCAHVFALPHAERPVMSVLYGMCGVCMACVVRACVARSCIIVNKVLHIRARVCVCVCLRSALMQSSERMLRVIRPLEYTGLVRPIMQLYARFQFTTTDDDDGLSRFAKSVT